MSDGKHLINDLREHVLTSMRSSPKCARGAEGLGNNDIEALAGLELRLDSQDHYLTYSILQALVRDGLVEVVRHPSAPRRPRYRIRA